MNKVIIWGHPLHSHTHSYIHYGFVRAFRYLGFETHWLDNDSKVDGFDFADSIFLTEGQVDAKMPLRKDCFYVLHNCEGAKYANLPKVLYLQVYGNGAIGERLNAWTKHLQGDRFGCLLQPWATDLLPPEIDVTKTMYDWPRERKIYFIGTCGVGLFGNKDVIDKFGSAAKAEGIEMVAKGGFTGGGMIDCDQSVNLVKKSFMAPALQGQWQVDNGYVPCRIFKNISYGHLGITNSGVVNEVFQGRLVYDPSPTLLFKKALEKVQSANREEIKELMHDVALNHTYVNRAQQILKLLMV